MTYRAEILNRDYFEQQYLFALPCDALKPYVECYWQLDLRNAALGGSIYWEQIFANLNASLVFNMGNAFGIKTTHNAIEGEYKKSIVVGQRNLPVLYRHVKGNFLFGVKFKPAGLSSILNIEASELKNAFVQIEDITRLDSLEEQLYYQKIFEERVLLTEGFLLQLLQKNHRQDYRSRYIQKTIAYFEQNRQNYTIGQLAGALCITPKSLTRYFAHNIGLTPKTTSRIVRFRKALPYYKQFGSAYDYEELGYTDFSHFMKDYHAYADIDTQGLD